MINNIIEYYHAIAQPDTRWYQRAYGWCKRVEQVTGIHINKVCGVVAVLSPGVQWSVNKNDAWNMLNGVSDYIPATYGRNVTKVMDILDWARQEDDVVDIIKPRKQSGMKCLNFYYNLRYPKRVGPVTIDRHALSVALGRVSTIAEGNLTPLQYERYADAYREASNVIGIKPHMLQSATWVQWRDRDK